MKSKYYVGLCVTALLSFYSANALALNLNERYLSLRDALPTQTTVVFRSDGELAFDDRGYFIKAQSERGCCVYLTEQVKCAVSLKTYCAEKAAKANIEYEFHDGKSCNDVAACPKKLK